MRFARVVPMLFAVVAAMFAGRAAALETKAPNAILMDADSGEVLYEKNAHEPMPPASMSKIMTMELLFQRLKDGRVKLTDTFHVSEKAWRMGGSKMWVLVNTEVPVEDLVRGVVVQSGNDACIVIAEALAGSEEAFAEMMNRRAAELGLKNSHFRNSTGWPADGHVMSAYDLALLARHIVHEYPDYYRYYAETEFTWSNIKQPNRNPLLYMNLGADGVKTGHTEASGYGLVGTAVRDGRRLIFVFNGLGSEAERADEARHFIEAGFRDFKRYELFGPGDKVAEAEVWGGTATKVPLKLADPLAVTMQRESRKGMKVTLTYEGPLRAPVAEGQVIGTLTVSAPDWPGRSVPVYAAAAVPEAGFLGKMGLALETLIFGDAR